MKKLGIKEKAPKDPGLPSQWPFKEELIKEFQFKKESILADEKRRKEERKRARQVRGSPAPRCRPLPRGAAAARCGARSRK
jgi:nuclear GTP-binding protein